MPPDFLIPEFQAFWQPLAPLLGLVNKIWGAGAAVLVPALVFWFGGSERGFRAALIMAVSGSLNSLLKWTLALPRPFYVTDHFTPLKLTQGYGMPSGNAQGPATLLAVLARHGPGWIWAVGLPLVLLAGVARIYYGVHSVNQVLVGWGLGVTLAWLALAVEQPLVDWVRRLTPRRRLGALLLATGLVFTIWFAAAQWSIHQRPPAPEWEERFFQLAVELHEEDEPYSLVEPADAGRIAGVLLGYGLVGLAYVSRGMFRLRRLRERLLAVVIGLPATFLWAGAAGAIAERLGSVVGGIAFVLLLVPLSATLPPVLFLLVPLAAVRLATRLGAAPPSE